jgi:TolB-like protein/Tfp pilus assembly protein PilF
MKRCPQCDRVETDNALVFCRADGAALISDPLSSQTATGSATAATETETSLLPHSTAAAGIRRSTGPTTALPGPSPAATTRDLPKPRRKTAIVIAGALAAVGIAVSIYFIMPRASTNIDSIAVLPFENRSGNPDSEYLSDGLAESLIYRLSQLPNLKVSPANSVFRYKGTVTDVKKIASELGVTAVMVGRMSQRGDDLSISVELIDAGNNKLLWGEQYDRKSSDLLVTQREIAAAIVQKLQLRLTGSEAQGITKTYTNSNDAYQHYLRGRFYWNKRNAENLRKAIEQFQAASEKDPGFALAYVGLADCYVLLPFYGDSLTHDTLTKAKAYVLRALEIDPNLGEAHASLAYTQYMLWNWAEAEPEFKRAIELSPNYATGHKWYGNYLEDMGRYDESLREFRKAQELDPLSLIIAENLADRYLRIGDLESAYAQSVKAIDLDPNFAGAHRNLSLVYLKQTRNAEALAAAQKAVELSKRTGINLSTLGYVYGQTNRRNEALSLIKELEEKYSRGEANGHHIAAVFAGLGDKEKTFAWLEKDFQNRRSTLVAWMDYTTFDPVRDDPRMADLRRRMNLPQ